jgi:hypothetical protein
MDAFKDSDEWLSSSDPLTLKSTPANRVYLENRLHRAFAAGWNAAIKWAAAASETEGGK